VRSSSDTPAWLVHDDHEQHARGVVDGQAALADVHAREPATPLEPFAHAVEQRLGRGLAHHRSGEGEHVIGGCGVVAVHHDGFHHLGRLQRG
jgi:hypothetical protein